MKMSSDLMTAIDIANRAESRASNDATTMMIRHLRVDHGYGIRKLNRLFRMPDKKIKEILGED